MNRNFNLRSKKPEIEVKKIVGMFLEFSGISMLGKLLIVSKEREALSGHAAAYHQGLRKLFSTAWNVSVEYNVLDECFIQKSQMQPTGPWHRKVMKGWVGRRGW